MPKLVPLCIDATAVSALSLKTSYEVARDTFKRDFFSSSATPYPNWDEVILNFDLSHTPPRLTLARPNTSATLEIQLVDPASTATTLTSTDSAITIPTSDATAIKVSTTFLDELRKHTTENKLRISIAGLHKRAKSDPLVQLLGRTTDHTYAGTNFYKQLSDVFFKSFMDERDKNGLVRYANQRGIFSYARLFIEDLPNDETGIMITLDADDDAHQLWSITNDSKPNYYNINYSRSLIQRNTRTNEKSELCKINLVAPYNRDSQTLGGPLQVVLEFADGCPKEQIDRITNYLIGLYEKRREDAAASTGEDAIPDPGKLTISAIETSSTPPLASKEFSSGKHNNRALLGVGIALLVSAIVFAILVGVGVLPALPFLASVHLQLGPLLLSGVDLSSIFITAVGVLIMGVTSIIRLPQASKAIAPAFTSLTTQHSGMDGSSSLSPAAAPHLPSPTTLPGNRSADPEEPAGGPENPGHGQGSSHKP